MKGEEVSWVSRLPQIRKPSFADFEKDSKDVPVFLPTSSSSREVYHPPNFPDFKRYFRNSNQRRYFRDLSRRKRVEAGGSYRVDCGENGCSYTHLGRSEAEKVGEENSYHGEVCVQDSPPKDSQPGVCVQKLSHKDFQPVCVRNPSKEKDDPENYTYKAVHIEKPPPNKYPLLSMLRAHALFQLAGFSVKAAEFGATPVSVLKSFLRSYPGYSEFFDDAEELTPSHPLPLLRTNTPHIVKQPPSLPTSEAPSWEQNICVSTPNLEVGGAEDLQEGGAGGMGGGVGGVEEHEKCTEPLQQGVSLREQTHNFLEGGARSLHSTPHLPHDSTPQLLPDSTPQLLPDSTPQLLPDSTPHLPHDSTPQLLPDSTPQLLPDSTSPLRPHQEAADATQQYEFPPKPPPITPKRRETPPFLSALILPPPHCQTILSTLLPFLCGSDCYNLLLVCKSLQDCIKSSHGAYTFSFSGSNPPTPPPHGYDYSEGRGGDAADVSTLTPHLPKLSLMQLIYSIVIRDSYLAPSSRLDVRFVPPKMIRRHASPLSIAVENGGGEAEKSIVVSSGVSPTKAPTFSIKRSSGGNSNLKYLKESAGGFFDSSCNVDEPPRELTSGSLPIPLTGGLSSYATSSSLEYIQSRRRLDEMWNDTHSCYPRETHFSGHLTAFYEDENVLSSFSSDAPSVRCMTSIPSLPISEVPAVVSIDSSRRCLVWTFATPKNLPPAISLLYDLQLEDAPTALTSSSTHTHNKLCQKPSAPDLCALVPQTSLLVVLQTSPSTAWRQKSACSAQTTHSPPVCVRRRDRLSSVLIYKLLGEASDIDYTTSTCSSHLRREATPSEEYPIEWVSGSSSSVYVHPSPLPPHTSSSREIRDFKEATLSDSTEAPSWYARSLPSSFPSTEEVRAAFSEAEAFKSLSVNTLPGGSSAQRGGLRAVGRIEMEEALEAALGSLEAAPYRSFEAVSMSVGPSCLSRIHYGRGGGGGSLVFSGSTGFTAAFDWETLKLKSVCLPPKDMKYGGAAKLLNFDEMTSLLVCNKGVLIYDERISRLNKFWDFSSLSNRRSPASFMKDLGKFSLNDGAITGITLQTAVSNDAVLLFDLRLPIVAECLQPSNAKRGSSRYFIGSLKYLQRLQQAGRSAEAIEFSSPIPPSNCTRLLESRFYYRGSRGVCVGGLIDQKTKRLDRGSYRIFGNRILSNNQRIWTLQGATEEMEQHGIAGILNQWCWGYSEPGLSLVFPSNIEVSGASNLRSDWTPASIESFDDFPSTLFVTHTRSSWIRMITCSSKSAHGYV